VLEVDLSGFASTGETVVLGVAAATDFAAVGATSGVAMEPAGAYPMTSQAATIGPVSYGVFLVQGWNLFAFPLSVTTPTTAEGLMSMIAAQGGQCTLAQAWDGSGWVSHEAGRPLDDFPIETGKGYALYCPGPVFLSLQGGQVTSMDLELGGGISVVGIPIAASGLAAAINAQGGGLFAIQGWNGGGFNTYRPENPESDFLLERGKGYAIHNTVPGTYQVSSE
jgi:hypothetical protein